MRYVNSLFDFFVIFDSEKESYQVVEKKRKKNSRPRYLGRPAKSKYANYFTVREFSCTPTFDTEPKLTRAEIRTDGGNSCLSMTNKKNSDGSDWCRLNQPGRVGTDITTKHIL